MNSRIVFVDVLMFFKQKTAYDMRISDWSSDVCSSDLQPILGRLFDCDAGAVRDVGAGSHLGSDLVTIGFCRLPRLCLAPMLLPGKALLAGFALGVGVLDNEGAAIFAPLPRQDRGHWVSSAQS